MIATTGGYIGDAPPYQGHVVTIDRASGRIIHVWNSLCSGQHRLLVPSRCPVSDSAIWARSGAVVEPGSGRLLVATGNATASRPFDGVSYWSDSVLELSPDAARLLHNWTPRNQAAAERQRRRPRQHRAGAAPPASAACGWPSRAARTGCSTCSISIG